MKKLSWLLLLCLLLTACGGETAEEETVTATDDGNEASTAATEAVTLAGTGTVDPGYTDRDLAGTWDGDEAVYISLNGSSATAEGDGVTVDGGVVSITSAGVYVLSGELTDGQIRVDADKSDKVQLVLDGVTVHCSDGPPVHIATADKVFITLAEGTENVLTDGEDYTLANGEDEPNAALYSKEDLTINGTGSLSITAGYRHGINSKDDLVITGGAITVTAAEDGVRGKDSVAVCGGEITIAAGGDGIKSNNSDDEGRGWVSIDGGEIAIDAGEDGIQAETVLQVTGGTLSIVTGGGSVEPTGSSDFPGGGWDAEDESGTSTKGIKAGTALYVLDGVLDIDALDDTVHSNGDVTISGGELTLASGDDGIHADGHLEIGGGTILITRSYEGLEGKTILITGGETRLTATDDGVNASDGSGGGFAPGGPGATSGDSDIWLRITGGLVVVSATGDGIDSNGDFYMDGGTVIVNGPTSGADGALDFDQGTGEITGGTLVAVGASGMAMNFASTSTQPSLMVNYASTQAAGTTLALLDGSGDTILAFSPEKDYQSVVISSPDMAVGETYTLYTGGDISSGEAADGLSTGAYSGGTEVVSVTMDETIVSISDSGGAVSGGMGTPGGGRGGMGGSSGGGRGQGGPSGDDADLPDDFDFTDRDDPDGGRPELPDSEGGEAPQLPEGNGPT